MTCPSPAATFTAEVAVVFVAAANPLTVEEMLAALRGAGGVEYRPPGAAGWPRARPLAELARELGSAAAS